MAASHRSFVALVAVLATALLYVATAADQAARNTLPIAVDAASTEVDYRNNSIVMRDVIISQGDVRVQADEARAIGGLNFENSRWTLSGNVRIRAEGGSLKSEQAVVSFANNAISRAVITGKPAEFEQARAGSAELAKGRANTIDYETANGTVSLLSAAWLSDGRNEIRGERLVYNVREQRVQARQAPDAKGSDGRVRIIIQPGAAPGAKPDAQKPKPPPANDKPNNPPPSGEPASTPDRQP
jgi:lipopolysaccharide export system protein LptA